MWEPRKSQQQRKVESMGISWGIHFDRKVVEVYRLVGKVSLQWWVQARSQKFRSNIILSRNITSLSHQLTMLWACKHMPVDNVTRLIICEGRMNLGYIGGISNFRHHAETIEIISVNWMALFINYVSWKYLLITLAFPSNNKHMSVSTKDQEWKTMYSVRHSNSGYISWMF